MVEAERLWVSLVRRCRYAVHVAGTIYGRVMESLENQNVSCNSYRVYRIKHFSFVRPLYNSPNYSSATVQVLYLNLWEK